MTDCKDMIAEALYAAAHDTNDLDLEKHDRVAARSLLGPILTAYRDHILTPTAVTTVEELDALPWGTVILSEPGNIWQHRDWNSVAGWYEPGSRWVNFSENIVLPATVLFRPTPTSEEK